MLQQNEAAAKHEASRQFVSACCYEIWDVVSGNTVLCIQWRRCGKVHIYIYIYMCVYIYIDVYTYNAAQGVCCVRYVFLVLVPTELANVEAAGSWTGRGI